MRKPTWKLAVIGLVFMASFPAKALTKSQSDDEQYVPIPELSAAPKTDDSSIFDDVRLHAGATFLNSFQDIALPSGERRQGSLRGIDLSFGVDLFTPHWICEGDLVNLPEAGFGDARVSSNGFELRLIYETPLMEAVTLHLGAGVASRGYNITTATGTDSFSSGATVLLTGVDYWVNESFTTGIELANHVPMASGDDPSSIDLGIKLGGHF